jgi:type IV pilus assembly protein PilA
VIQFDDFYRHIQQTPKMNGRSNLQHGFTLIELMIVVTIIGILAAVAVPMYLDYAVRSQISDGITLAKGAKNAVTEYFQDRGSMPASNADAGLSASNEIQGRYTASIAVGNADGVITITYGNQANAVVFGEAITLTANTAQAGSVQWVCSSAGVIEDKHLPSACR